jgi:hypothetical protein
VEAVTLAADLKQVAVVHQAIGECGDGGRVAEQLGPRLTTKPTATPMWSWPCSVRLRPVRRKPIPVDLPRLADAITRQITRRMQPLKQEEFFLNVAGSFSREPMPETSTV